MQKKLILFLCAGNAARSRMAGGGEDHIGNAFRRVRDELGDFCMHFPSAGSKEKGDC